MKKTIAILTAALAIITGSSWVSAQIDGGRPRSGQAVYEEYCARCYGLTGEGNGPHADALIVPPANFHSPIVKMKSDEQLLTSIEFGLVMTPMHAWRGRLSEQEMQDVLAYVRLLVGAADHKETGQRAIIDR